MTFLLIPFSSKKPHPSTCDFCKRAYSQWCAQLLSFLRGAHAFERVRNPKAAAVAAQEY